MRAGEVLLCDKYISKILQSRGIRGRNLLCPLDDTRMSSQSSALYMHMDLPGQEESFLS